MSKGILDSTIGALNTSLNLRQFEQNVISSNIANSDTPGYKAKDVEFEQDFRQALGASDDLAMQGDEPTHLSPKDTDAVTPEVFENPNGIESLDGNTVNRSEEMTKMAENQIQYNAGIELLKRKLGLLKYSVNDGGGGGQ